MKNKIEILGLALLLASVCAKAQTGIYRSATDFKNNTLAFEIRCGQGKTKIKGAQNTSTTIEITNDGKKVSLKKAEVYGYKNCQNESFRFYKNNAYKVAESGNVIVYTREVNAGKGKEFKIVNAWYFSTSPDGAVMPLTADYLKIAYKNNTQYSQKLSDFLSKEKPETYDDTHNTYMVNYVLSQVK